MTNLLLGKHDAVRSPRLSDLTVYSQGKLPAPPANVGAPTVPWGMDLNDRLGICTIAGVDHLLGAWNADLDEHDRRPTDTQMESTYFTMTGGQDTGLNEQSVLRTWQTEGLFGNKIAAFAPINTSNLVTLHQSIAFYNGSYLGIQCPQSAQQQFSEGKPWTYVPGSPIEGGHCIVAVGYSATALLCVSWGALVEVTYPFLAHYLDEAWCVLSHEAIEHGGDSLGIDVASLQADIASI